MYRYLFITDFRSLDEAVGEFKKLEKDGWICIERCCWGWILFHF